MVLREEIYATASIAGGITFVTLHALGAPFPTVMGATVAITLGLRLAAIRWNLRLPVFAWVEWPSGRRLTRDGRDALTDHNATENTDDQTR